MNPTITRTTQEQFDLSAARILIAEMHALLETKKQVVFAIPGGRSVAGIFTHLLADTSIPWARVHIFMVDERLVPITDPESNYRLAHEAFLWPLVAARRLPQPNVHPFVVEPNRHDYGISGYAQALDAVGGGYDIVLLSSGEDGHVGALYPNHHSVLDPSQKFIIMHDSPKPPKDRMSSSLSLMRGASGAILLFKGESKISALERFMDPHIDYITCPAKLVLSIPQAHVVTDQR